VPRPYGTNRRLRQSGGHKAGLAAGFIIAGLRAGNADRADQNAVFLDRKSACDGDDLVANDASTIVSASFSVSVTCDLLSVGTAAGPRGHGMPCPYAERKRMQTGLGVSIDTPMCISPPVSLLRRKLSIVPES